MFLSFRLLIFGRLPRPSVSARQHPGQLSVVGPTHASTELHVKRVKTFTSIESTRCMGRRSFYRQGTAHHHGRRDSRTSASKAASARGCVDAHGPQAGHGGNELARGETHPSSSQRFGVDSGAGGTRTPRREWQVRCALRAFNLSDPYCVHCLFFLFPCKFIA
jgi:hypothetical protein